jgi:hypothetical protein
MDIEVHILKTWKANKECALLYVFRGNLHAATYIISQPYIRKAKKWRKMLKKEVEAYRCNDLSSGLEEFTYYIKGAEDEGIEEAFQTTEHTGSYL